jgi:hypothetical protein
MICVQYNDMGVAYFEQLYHVGCRMQLSSDK